MDDDWNFIPRPKVKNAFVVWGFIPGKLNPSVLTKW